MTRDGLRMRLSRLRRVIRVTVSSALQSSLLRRLGPEPIQRKLRMRRLSKFFMMTVLGNIICMT